jgi:hypothetical protein
MKTRTFNSIDGMVGISVFLLLTVAVVAGQAPASSPQAIRDEGITPPSKAAVSLILDDEEFSLLVEALQSMPGGSEVVIGRWREDVQAERHPGIPE